MPSAIPEGYTTVTPWIISTDTPQLIDFLVAAFDGVELGRMANADGSIGHAEIRIGDAIVMAFDAPSGLAALVIEDDESSLKWGAIRFVNSTSKELAIAIGKEAKVIPPAWKPVDFQPTVDETVSLIVAAPEELRKPADVRKILVSIVWSAETDVRALAIIVPGTDARLSSIALKVISEDRRALAAQKAAKR